MMPDKELVSIRKKLDALLETINEKSFEFTPNAQSLAWVVRQLSDIFDNHLGLDKYDFYALLGQGAITYQNQNKNVETELGIATAVIDEAYKFLREWEDAAGKKPSYYRA